MHRHMTPVHKRNAKILLTRRLAALKWRNLVFFFWNCLTKKTNNSSIIAFSRESRHYLPHAQSTEVIFFVLFILLSQFVTSLLRWPHHFCAALMVTHKFRLCLHPRGMLRVQSLHLPMQGLARRFLPFHFTILSFLIIFYVIISSVHVIIPAHYYIRLSEF